MRSSIHSRIGPRRNWKYRDAHGNVAVRGDEAQVAGGFPVRRPSRRQSPPRPRHDGGARMAAALQPLAAARLKTQLDRSNAAFKYCSRPSRPDRQSHDGGNGVAHAFGHAWREIASHDRRPVEGSRAMARRSGTAPRPANPYYGSQDAPLAHPLSLGSMTLASAVSHRKAIAMPDRVRRWRETDHRTKREWCPALNEVLTSLRRRRRAETLT